jgi:hypothetical protein
MMDAEGCEDWIILGAGGFVRHMQFVVAEVLVADRFEQGYAFADFIRLMEKHGFAVCDILDIGRAQNSRVTFMDLVFRHASWPDP